MISNVGVGGLLSGKHSRMDSNRVVSHGLTESASRLSHLSQVVQRMTKRMPSQGDTFILAGLT